MTHPERPIFADPRYDFIVVTCAGRTVDVRTIPSEEPGLYDALYVTARVRELARPPSAVFSADDIVLAGMNRFVACTNRPKKDITMTLQGPFAVSKVFGRLADELIDSPFFIEETFLLDNPDRVTPEVYTALKVLRSTNEFDGKLGVFKAELLRFGSQLLEATIRQP